MVTIELSAAKNQLAHGSPGFEYYNVRYLWDRDTSGRMGQSLLRLAKPDDSGLIMLTEASR
jgi:hypothetical protein